MGSSEAALAAEEDPQERGRDSTGRSGSRRRGGEGTGGGVEQREQWRIRWQPSLIGRMG